MTQRYFALGPLAGTPYPRYALLDTDGRTVIGTQLSRPDGTEVRPPADVRWRLRPFIGSEGRGAPPAPARFHNVSPAAHVRARHNAGRRQKRRPRKEDR